MLDQADTEAYRLTAGKRAVGDTTGVLHLITQPDAESHVISDTEFRNFFCLLVAASNDSTRYSIAAALHAFLHRPELLEQLRGSGPALWQTVPDEFIRWAWPVNCFRRKLPLLGRFQLIVDATCSGVLKPDARAYAAVTEGLGLPAAACVFVDDQPQNVQGARDFGMRAVAFDVPAPAVSYHEVLQALGIA